MNKEKLVRVYVGTWKKYNNGSIYGKWLTLNNYSTYDEFLGAVKLSQGVYLLPKYKIDNVFYFHDEGPNYDFYKELYNDENKIKDYFITQNLSEYDYLIKDIKEHTTYLEVLKNNRANLIINESYSYRNNLSKATDKDKQELIIALEWAKNNMIKRLNTYLKRYGTSKIHLKTYWADR